MNYEVLYPEGTLVVIAPLEELERFRKTWQYHHKLETTQLSHAGQRARVIWVGSYHGGEILYALDGIVGIWHEYCLRSNAAEISS
jgi:hypothetical protein